MSRSRIAQITTAATVAALSIAFFFVGFGSDPFDLSKHSSSKEARELLFALGVATAFAVICHLLIRRWLLACVICTGALTLTVTVLSFAAAPPSETPFVLIGAFTIAIASFALAAVVGVVFLLFRRRASIT